MKIKLIIWILYFLLFNFFCFNAEAYIIAQQYDMFGCWPLNETSGAVNDSYNGYDTSAVTFSSNNVDGVITTARGNGYANVGEIDSIIGDQFTVSSWFKISGFPAGNAAGIVAKFGSSADYSWTLKTDVNKDLGFQVRNTGGTLIGADWTTTLNLSVWYHAIGVYNGSNVMLYFNGIKVAQGALTGDVYDSATSVPVAIGRHQRTGHYTFNGIIDEVMLLNRSINDNGCAIGQVCGGDIAKIYNSSYGVSCWYAINYNITESGGSPTNQTPTPTSLINTSNGLTNITLSWNGNYGSKYLIFQNGTNVVNTTSSPYTRTGLINNTRYGFHVKAYNLSYVNFLSNLSNKIEVRTKQTTQVVPSSTNITINYPPNNTIDIFNSLTFNLTMNVETNTNGTIEIKQKWFNVSTLTGVTLGYTVSYDPENHSIWMGNWSDTDIHPQYLEEYDAYTLKKTGKTLPQPGGTEDCAFNPKTKRFNCIHNPGGVVKIMDKSGLNYSNVSIGVAGPKQGIDVNSDGNWTVCVSGTRYKFDSDTGTQLSTGSIASCTCDGVTVRFDEQGKDKEYWVACDGFGVKVYDTSWTATGYTIPVAAEAAGIEGVDFHENQCTLYITFDDHSPGVSNGYYVKNICDPLIANITQAVSSGLDNSFGADWVNLSNNATYYWYHKYYTDAGASGQLTGYYEFNTTDFAGDSCDTNSWDCSESCVVNGLNAGGNKITASNLGKVTITSKISNCRTDGVYLSVENGCKVVNAIPGGGDICQ